MKNRIIKFRAWDNHNHRMLDIGNDLPSYQGWEIMQFTGLKDRHGKEIYEGDIIETGVGTKHQIEWNSNLAAWTIDGLEYFIVNMPTGEPIATHKFSEVIGNIYEDTSLI